jgi:hypothetical protein
MAGILRRRSKSKFYLNRGGAQVLVDGQWEKGFSATDLTRIFLEKVSFYSQFSFIRASVSPRLKISFKFLGRYFLNTIWKFFTVFGHGNFHNIH